MRTVKEISNITGISVRTLHYYDKIGLLKPTDKSNAGYRLYDDKALEQLQQILFFREFDIPLKEIKALMDNPALDRSYILQMQRKMLKTKINRLKHLVEGIDNILKGDNSIMDFQLFNRTEIEEIKEGKIRKIYDNGNTIIMVATDRISCFDVVLNNEVAGKGKILTQMSRFWFEMTKDIVPNHMISVDVKDMPEFFRQDKFNGRCMLCRKLRMLPIECIVRGYISGSLMESYKSDGTVCGINLPKGLKESDKLPESVYTPSTKAESGVHDENISYEQSIKHLEKYFPEKGRVYGEKIREYSIALYKKCAEYAFERGIIIADTKFEFGLDEDGNIVLGDELLTPDCSRFWLAEEYEPGHSQPSLDKQPARDWIKKNKNHNMTLPQDIVEKTADIYLESYEMLTGEKLQVAL